MSTTTGDERQMGTMRPLKVADVMTRQVVTAGRGDNLRSVAQLMHRHNVSGLPVVDREGRLCGIVTEADLLRIEEDPERSFLERILDRHGFVEIQRRAAELTAEDVMTPEVITAEPEAPLRDAVRRLLEADVKRMPVVDERGRLVGIVSRRDLLTPLLRNDEEIRRQVELLLREVVGFDPARVSVAVKDGMVTLQGEVPGRSDNDIAIRLVERVDGVLGVRNQLSFVRDDGGGRPSRSASIKPPAKRNRG